MTLTQIVLFVGLALVLAATLPGRWRGPALYVASLGALFWLQPPLAIRWLDYSLPLALFLLTVLLWWITLPAAGRRLSRADALALAAGAGMALLLALARYVPALQALEITTRPPEITGVLLALLLAGLLLALLARAPAAPLLWAALGVIIGLFLSIKTEPLALALSAFLRGQSGQETAAAAAADLNWLGFSYVAFRLIHTVRDRQSGLLPACSLAEYVTYVLFFPALTAGPIDRAGRFVEELRSLPARRGLEAARLAEGCRRIAVGLFKKFVIADSLALFALNTATADQAVSTGALWVMLYAYALRLFFDFSGYTDIAIGIGLLFGITLPENFDRPYLKNNLNAFWQSWHMSLSAWVRAYVYSPMQRSLLRRQPRPPQELITLVCHLSTMLIIGLWHGVTLPFAVWGLWHGAGLFVHKLWSDRSKRWYLRLKTQPRGYRAWSLAGTLLTFHFVCLGWVWFALPDMGQALRVFLRLFGVA
ncbi:MAG: hypothetical protein MUE40_20895 [Anaerolineae bacterium]|jgi:alginate O-acetyltransferase complex protein AlgI|nr:hypothetical protein [Anaerolineae bacterium]